TKVVRSWSYFVTASSFNYSRIFGSVHHRDIIRRVPNFHSVHYITLHDLQFLWTSLMYKNILPAATILATSSGAVHPGQWGPFLTNT
ncbi:hypothetical protein L9F63_002972, partial [Diploptera punctata]